MALQGHVIILACFVTSMAMRMQHQQKLASKVTGEEKAQWCWGSSWSKMKEFYFEGMFDLPESEDHTALQLIRDPENPMLRIHKVTQWVVRPTPKDPSEDPNAGLPWIPDAKDPDIMQWLPACMKPAGQDACKPEDVTEIKLLDVEYIAMIPEIMVEDPNTGQEDPEMGLKIVMPDGTGLEFAGGLYLPRKLMKAAMKRAEKEYAKFSGLGAEARQQASAADNMANEAWKNWGKSFKGFTGTGVMSGAVGGTTLGTALVVAGVPVYGAGPIGTLLLGAGYGLVGGVGAGLAVGAVLGAVVGGAFALSDYRRQRRELGFSAVEKMWNKLECHQHFYHCNSTFIVPKGKTCPGAPTPEPMPQPTPEPTPAPTPEPTPQPTPAPTPAPKQMLTPGPTPQPTRASTPAPTSADIYTGDNSTDYSDSNASTYTTTTAALTPAPTPEPMPQSTPTA